MRKFIILIAESSDCLNVKLRFENRGTVKTAKKICIEFLNITGYKEAGITFFGKNGIDLYWYRYQNGQFKKGSPKDLII